MIPPYDKSTLNKIYLMQIYSDAYCKKYNLTIQEFFEENKKKHILDAILDISHNFYRFPLAVSLEDVENYSIQKGGNCL